MISPELARELFHYMDGKLYWRKKVSKKHGIESEAGTVNQSGYRVITYKGEKMHAHRLVWLWHGRELPKQLDHINRDPLDNRIENLRAADYHTNAFNMGLGSDNKSGFKNVSWCNTYKRWVVQITANGKKATGRFRDISDAAAFAAQKRIEMHGQFACHGG